VEVVSMSELTAEQEVQLEEAKLIAEQEAKAVVNSERRAGETDEAVLKNIFDETYKRVLADELNVQG
jgi:hypothetical protein